MPISRCAPVSLLLSALLLFGCSGTPKAGSKPIHQSGGSACERLLANLEADDVVAPILFAPEQAFPMHRAQLLIATIDESSSPPVVSRKGVRDDRAYFYPASTIKLFAAIAAIQTLEELQTQGVPVTVDSPMVIHPMFDGETIEHDDPSNSVGGSITLRHEIRKLFLVSDNRAFNRLLGFVGRDDLNRMMHKAGLASVRVTHRLSVGYSAEQNRQMPRIDLQRTDGSWHTIPARTDSQIESSPKVPMLEVGTAEMVGGTKLARPKSFARSNRVSLRDLQDALIMIVRPDVDLGKPGFQLHEAHRALLLNAMRELPRESENPRYDPEKYPDDWVKFMLPGLRSAAGHRSVQIYNKIGLAYGFTSTTAGISLDAEPPSLFITGTLYTNENGTLNDNVYEYDAIAFPYWEAVGEAAARALDTQSDH